MKIHLDLSLFFVHFILRKYIYKKYVKMHENSWNLWTRVNKYMEIHWNHWKYMKIIYESPYARALRALSFRIYCRLNRFGGPPTGAIDNIILGYAHYDERRTATMKKFAAWRYNDTAIQLDSYNNITCHLIVYRIIYIYIYVCVYYCYIVLS